MTTRTNVTHLVQFSLEPIDPLPDQEPGPEGGPYLLIESPRGPVVEGEIAKPIQVWLIQEE